MHVHCSTIFSVKPKQRDIKRDRQTQTWIDRDTDTQRNIWNDDRLSLHRWLCGWNWTGIFIQIYTNLPLSVIIQTIKIMPHITEDSLADGEQTSSADHSCFIAGKRSSVGIILWKQYISKLTCIIRNFDKCSSWFPIDVIGFCCQ